MVSYLFSVSLLLAGGNVFSQKQGTLVIEPEIGELFTTLGPRTIDYIYPSQLCDSLSIVQCNDLSITVTSYQLTIELTREFTLSVIGNRVPDTICTLSKKLRGDERVYIEKVIGRDANGQQVELPPVRMVVLSERGRINVGEIDSGIVPKNE